MLFNSKSLLWILTIVFFLSGCSATSLNTSVTSFYDNQILDTTKTFVIIPYEAQYGDIEHRTYGDMISSRLEHFGLTAVNSREKADFGVMFYYSVGQGEIKTDWQPIVNEYYNPEHPDIKDKITEGYTPREHTEYTKTFVMDIIDLRDSDQRRKSQLYHGTVTQTGIQNSFSAVGRCLIDALFHKFPGHNGSTREVVGNC